MINKRALIYIDWYSLGITCLLLCYGLLFVWSATYTQACPVSPYFIKQLIGSFIGIIIYTVFCFAPLRRLIKLGTFFYAMVLLLLCYTYLAGFIGMGARRWISLYFIRFQPAELAKLFLPAFFCYQFLGDDILGQVERRAPNVRAFFVPLAVLGITFLLIAKQPDLGTALIVLFCGLLLLWLLGLGTKYFAVAGLCLALVAPVLWHALKPYQQKRVLVMLGGGDVRREGYQTLQSKIAIGSGGLLGKGLLKGTQNKLLFLPEDHTDFIFAVICEEWGLLGALLVLLLYGALALRLFYVIAMSSSILRQLLAAGLLAHILLSSCINIAMTCGLAPIVGIPLPLFSYGLTNLWVTLASLGWIGNIARYRHLP